jgi:hypothetical protein
MDIRSCKNETEYIFLSVDESFFRKNEFIFTFLPRHEQEARTFVANLIPYIRHKHPKVCLSTVFVQEALSRNESNIWNADTQEILSSSDLYIDQNMESLEEFNMLDNIEQNNYVIHTLTPNNERVQRLFSGDEATSVGSLFTTHEGKNSTSTTHRSTTSYTNTLRSQSTTLTLEEVDSKLNTLSKDMQNLQNLIHTFINHQNNNLYTPTQNNKFNQVAGVQMETYCEAT